MNGVVYFVGAGIILYLLLCLITNFVEMGM